VGIPNVELAPTNTGRYHYGDAAYRNLHRRAWQEAVRVLKPGGVFVLNTKDTLAKGARGGPMTEWHTETLIDQGLEVVERVPVPCPGLRHGANRERLTDEWVTVLVKPTDAVSYDSIL
jgi:SAM-dependent methyltransferase